jgi:hypothetical protein
MEAAEAKVGRPGARAFFTQGTSHDGRPNLGLSKNTLRPSHFQKKHTRLREHQGLCFGEALVPVCHGYQQVQRRAGLGNLVP